MDSLLFGIMRLNPYGRTMAVRGKTTAPTALAANSFRTELSVNGVGVLHTVLWHNSENGGVGAWVRITIDGGTPQLIGATGSVQTNILGIHGGGMLVQQVFFKSLVVEMYNGLTVEANVGSVINYTLVL